MTTARNFTEVEVKELMTLEKAGDTVSKLASYSNH
jgi:hypothetical protein